MKFKITTLTGTFEIKAGTIQAALAKFGYENPNEYIVEISQIDAHFKLPLSVEN